MRKIKKIKGADVFFRTHSFSELMGGIVSSELTEKQKQTILEFQQKQKLTENQNAELQKLIAKRDAPPQLNEGGKSLVQKLFRELVRGTTDLSIETKYMSKGLECEDLAINRIAKVNGWGAVLNANKLGIELKDSIGVGHPDAVKTSIRLGFDAKCSFTDASFPLHQKELKETNYIWQAKRLAMMAGFDSWHICYSLENTPEDLIVKDAWKLWKNGMNEGQLTDSFLDEVRQMHNFDHLSDWERVKTFEIKLMSEDITLIEKRAQMARNYFDELMEDYLSNEKKFKNY